MREQDMLDTLLVESREHLQRMEPLLVELEGRGGEVSDEIVNEIFRSVHSIKGGFSFLAIAPVVDLAHALEGVMARVRDRNLDITPELIDALLGGIDTLREMIDNIERADSVGGDQAVQALQQFLDSQNKVTGKVTRKKGDGDATPVRSLAPLAVEQIREGRRHGRHFYQVQVLGGTDVKGRCKSWADFFTRWERYGRILASAPDRTQLESYTGDTAFDRQVTVLFSSVLESDLVSRATGIPSERVGELGDDFAPEQSPDASDAQASDDEAPQPQAERRRSAELKDDVLWVRVGLLNRLMNLAGELVLARNQLMQTLDTRLTNCADVATPLQDARSLLGTGETADIVAQRLQQAGALSIGELSGMRTVAQSIDSVTTALQESILLTRMQSLSALFDKFPRVIRDISRKLEKEISLDVAGHEVELDKTIVELLSDPLTHLVRNAADHGIEAPDVREAHGKPRAGRISLRAHQEGGRVIVSVHDDGAGIDVAAVQEHAVERGIVTAELAAKMSRHEIQALIFAPGMSTADDVSDLSGRGVGMDVVRTNLLRLGGTVDVDSQPGKGTTVTLQLPLTLAIIPSLILRTEGRRFAMPQVAVEEIVRVKGDEAAKRIEHLQEHEVLRLRDALLPLVRLSTVLQIPPTYVDGPTGEPKLDRRSRWSDRRASADAQSEERDGQQSNRRSGPTDRRVDPQNALRIVVLNLDARRYGLVIDHIDDNEEIVVKPLPECLKEARCYSGATIMGDGRVAMILDPSGIAERAGLQFEQIAKHMPLQHHDDESDAAERHELLLFSAGSDELLAVPLSGVARIERIKPETLETIGDKTFLRYTDSSLLLHRLHELIPLQPPRTEKNEFVLVPKNTGAERAFLLTSITDTVSAPIVYNRTSVKAPGIAGTVVLGDRLVVVLDLEQLVSLAKEAC
ncbi:MAG: hypothetical protein GF331_05520 [Chitinivibrionales bacterium]|nr:hypothetical protein [Chitinivibrionales bacterium]